MESVGGEMTGRSSDIKTVATASLVGTTIEWYDFYLYGTAAALVFPALFFPQFSATAGILAAFATYGAGFVVRPLGGAFFGHYGDKIGRKSMLVATLLIMGIATFLVGVLPTYAQIGVLAPVLLVLLRFLQGFSAGGEWGGAVLMSVEHSPEGRRGFYGSFPQMGVPAGLLLANLAFLLVAALPEQAFLSWGWRVPFLLSIVLIGVGLFIRLKVMESPAFARVKETRTEARVPIVDVFRAYPREVALAVGSYLVISVVFTIAASFALSYATTVVGVEQRSILFVVLLSSALMLAVLPVAGALSDRLGRKPMYLAATVGLGLWSFPLFWLLNTGAFALMLAGVAVAFVLLAVGYGPLASLYAEMFGTRVRYSGASAAYQIGTVLGGAFAPFIATALLASRGVWSVPVYMVAVAVVSTACVLFIRETHRSDLEEASAEEERLAPGLEPRVR